MVFRVVVDGAPGVGAEHCERPRGAAHALGDRGRSERGELACARTRGAADPHRAGARSSSTALRSYARSRCERYIDRVHVLKYTPSVDGPGVADVLVLFNAAKGGMVGPNNQTLSYAAPAQRVHRDFLLVHVEGRWLIARITAV